MTVARNLVVRVGADVSNLQRSLNQAQKTLNKAAKSMQRAGQTLTKGLTLPIVAAGTALGLMTMRVASAADDLNTLSNTTGISVEKLQTMKFAAEQAGISLEDITGAQTRLVRSVGEAHKGNEQLIRSFHDLGISIYDLEGNLRSTDDIFWDVIESLEGVENQSLRDSIAMDLLGKSARELNSIILLGRDGFEALEKQLEDLGWVMSKDQVDALNNLNNMWKTVRAGIAFAASTIAIEMIPIMEEFFKLMITNLPIVVDKFTTLIQKFKELSPPQQKLILGTGIFAIVLGPLLIIIGKIISAVAMIIGLFKVLAGWFALLLNPVGLLIGVLLALGAMFIWLYKTSDNFRIGWDVIWGAIKNAAVVVMDYILNFGKNFSIGLTEIFNIIARNIKKAMDGIANTVTKIVDTIMRQVDRVMAAVRSARDAAANITSTAVSGVKGAIGTVIGGIKSAVGLATGGVVTKPTLAMVGEGKESEAVLPLSRLDAMLKGGTGGNIVQVVLDGRVIQEYIDKGFGNRLTAWGGAI